MKHLLSIIFLFTFFISNVFAEENEKSRAKPISQLDIIHINDINGNLQPVNYIKENDRFGRLTGGYARVAYFAKKFKEKNKSTLFMAGGDVLGPTPFSSRSKGKVVIDMFNLSGLDVWSPGTYDFLYGLEEINKRVAEAKFEVINTNIFDKKTGKNWIKPYTIIERDNKKIAILGVTTLNLLSNMPDDIKETFEVKSPIEVIGPIAKKLKKEVDLIILIAQMNNGEKAEILNRTDVDFIVGSIGSPTEANLTGLTIPNGKFAVSTQGNCWSVGQLSVEWDKDNDIEYKNIKQNMMEINKYPESLLEKEVAPVLNKLIEYENKVDPVIGYLNREITRDEALNFVANVMRHTSRADIAILDKTFFLRGAFIDQEITKESIYTLIHLPFRAVNMRVTGAALRSYLKNNGIDNMVTVGINNQTINGNNIIDSEQYLVATEESFFKSKIFWRDVANFVYTDKPINDLVYEYVEKQKKEVIDVDKLDDYTLWKAGFNLDLDPQLLNVQLPPDSKYTYLTWKGDQNAARWGGLVSATLKRAWQKNTFDNLLEFELRQQQTITDKIEKYQDRIKFESTYITDVGNNFLNPFVNLKIASFFVNPDITKAHPFITEFSGGLSHKLPFGFRFREGIEARKDLFNSLSPLQIGAVFGLGFTNTIFFITENLESKIYIPADLSIVVTDIESKSVIPLGSFANLFYKINLYNESKDFKNWAVRHNLGLNFKFDMPLTF